MDMYDLSRSLNGFAKLLNGAAEMVFTGNVPPRRLRKSKARFFVTPAEAHCFDINAIAQLFEGMDLMSELTATLGTEAIQKILTISFLKESNQDISKEQVMIELMKTLSQMSQDQRATQELLMSRWAGSEQHVKEMVELFATQNRNSIVESVHPIGRSCSQAEVGDVSNGGVVVDLPTAQVIRDRQGELGPMQEYLAHIDGVTAHSKTLRLEIIGDDSGIISADLLDPAGGQFPNLYTQSIGHGYLMVTAKAVFEDEKIRRLSVMDARTPTDEEVQQWKRERGIADEDTTAIRLASSEDD